MLSVSLRSVKAIQLYLIFFVFSLYVVHIKLINFSFNITCQMLLCSLNLCVLIIFSAI